MADRQKKLETHLLRAARRILQPLVKIMLRNGVSAQVFGELSRKVYVDVAAQDFQPPNGKKQTVANISVLTGLNRKEVSRLASLPEFGDEDKAQWTRCGRVLDGWLTDAEFQTDAGFPMDLPFTGASPNFSDLVNRYSGDMYPLPVRQELERTGAIREVAGMLRMTKRGYVPSKDPSAILNILGIDTAELIDTIDHNLQTENDPLLQYKVLADNLPAEKIDDFNAFSRRIAMNAIDEIRLWLIEHDAGDDRPGKALRYFAGVGVYQINRPIPPTIGADQDVSEQDT